MAEFVVAMLVHTPVWVYVLLVFLLFRGIKARVPATVTLEKLALIPALFLFWDIYDLVTYRNQSISTYLQWIHERKASTAVVRCNPTDLIAPSAGYRHTIHHTLPHHGCRSLPDRGSDYATRLQD